MPDHSIARREKSLRSKLRVSIAMLEQALAKQDYQQMCDRLQIAKAQIESMLMEAHTGQPSP